MIGAFTRLQLGRVQSRTESADANPKAAQVRLHHALADALKGTAVGTTQNPKIFESLEAFRDNLVLTTYDQARSQIEHAMVEPKSDIFERGTTRLFGHTASRKFVPFTAMHVAMIRGFMNAALAQATVSRKISALWSGKPMMIFGTLRIGATSSGVLGGYSGAIALEKGPASIKKRVRPKIEAIKKQETAARLASYEKHLLEELPRAICGLPEQVAGVLYALLAGPKGELVAAALKRVKAFLWCGAPLGPYEGFFRRTFAEDCAFFDVLAATEGPIGFSAEREGLYRLAHEHALLLFMPPHRLSEMRFAWELDPGDVYEVLFNGFNGLLGYRTGDRILVESQNPLRFSLEPKALNIKDTLELLGPDCTDFAIFERPEERRALAWIETPAAIGADKLQTLSAAIGVDRIDLRTLTAGRLSMATIPGADHGLVKLPRLFREPKLAEMINRFLAERT